jgi:hypothetical protein
VRYDGGTDSQNHRGESRSLSGRASAVNEQLQHLSDSSCYSIFLITTPSVMLAASFARLFVLIMLKSVRVLAEHTFTKDATRRCAYRRTRSTPHRPLSFSGSALATFDRCGLSTVKCILCVGSAGFTPFRRWTQRSIRQELTWGPAAGHTQTDCISRSSPLIT